jgi:hypothetical protein
MNRTPLAATVLALLLPACGPDEPQPVVEADDVEARTAATATPEERLNVSYAADPATAAACAAADTLAFDLLARRLDSDEAVLAALHRIHELARESDDSQLPGLVRLALATGAQEQHGAVGYHLGSVQNVCGHYLNDSP